MEEFTLSDKEICFIQAMDKIDTLFNEKFKWEIYDGWNDNIRNDFNSRIFRVLCRQYFEQKEIRGIVDNLVRTGYLTYKHQDDYGPMPFYYCRTNKMFNRSKEEKLQILNEKVQKYREQLEKEMEI